MTILEAACKCGYEDSCHVKHRLHVWAGAGQQQRGGGHQDPGAGDRDQPAEGDHQPAEARHHRAQEHHQEAGESCATFIQGGLQLGGYRLSIVYLFLLYILVWYMPLVPAHTVDTVFCVYII